MKRNVDFETEAGHAETVFDLEFCPGNRDVIASCSYDGSVRVWNVN
jgi:WD40 repeat protein